MKDPEGFLHGPKDARNSGAEGSYVELIRSRLRASGHALRTQFSASATAGIGTRHIWLDDFLPDQIAHEIHGAFPMPDRMRLLSSFRERKYTSKDLNRFDPALDQITFAFQDPEVIATIEEITGVRNQMPDPSLYAGGLSIMGKGHFLNPHIDNSHDADGRYYRTLNLLYYVTPGWRLENGGNLELWDRRVRRCVTIPCLFNRLVVMETHPWSWHSVSPIVGDGIRCCVSNYYFSAESPTGKPYSNVTSFSARPEQKVRRAVAWVDTRARQGVRKLFPRGLGRKDVYAGRNR